MPSSKSGVTSVARVSGGDSIFSFRSEGRGEKFPSERGRKKNAILVSLIFDFPPISFFSDLLFFFVSREKKERERERKIKKIFGA